MEEVSEFHVYNPFLILCLSRFTIMDFDNSVIVYWRLALNFECVVSTRLSIVVVRI